MVRFLGVITEIDPHPVDLAVNPLVWAVYACTLIDVRTVRRVAVSSYSPPRRESTSRYGLTRVARCSNQASGIVTTIVATNNRNVEPV